MRAFPTTTHLHRFVEDVRVVENVRGGAGHVERMPDGRTSLVFRVLDGGDACDLTVAGPRTQALFKHFTGVARVVMLRFKPGRSSPLLGVAATALTDRIVPLDAVWGDSVRDLSHALLEAPDLSAVLDEMSRAIAEHAAQRPEPASARLVRRAVQLIENGEGRVESVASELGVTPRHLRRAFAEGIGVGPKDFARGVRLRRAIALSTTSHDWARIAADAGFYDQAHLIAEFKSLVGLTPGAFLKRQSRTAATAQQAA